MRDSNLRSLIKGVSWRVIGTIDTFILAYIYFGSAKIAAPIAATKYSPKFSFIIFMNVSGISSAGGVMQTNQHILGVY